MKRKIRVFIASPNDLAGERNAFRKAIDLLNIGFGDGANVEFEALGWEDTLASTGRRSQSVINEEIDKCDVFILALTRRWGQDAPDAKPYSSYTEEEFHRALERWKKEEKPEIFVFFKRVDAVSEADPGPQLQKVMEFRRQLEETRQVLYHYFDDEKSFMNEVDRHLRAYAKGELPKSDANKNIVVLPVAALEEVKKAKEIAQQKALEAEKAKDSEKASILKLETMQLEIAEDCSVLSKEGKIEYARQKFSKLVVESSNTRVLSLAYEFFNRTGDLDSAQMILEKWLNLSGKGANLTETLNAVGNLGNLYKIRGDLKAAEEMYRKSLTISEALGNKEGISNNYNNIGILYQIRGDFEIAEEMFRKSLAIEEELCSKEGLSRNYCNLGNLYNNQGDLETAEEMYRKSLAIEEELGLKEGMAIVCCNFGNLYHTLGDLETAEEMYRKSLSINEELGYKEGLAMNYCNLGNIFTNQGDLETAEEMYRKSLAINEELDRKEGLAINYCNLGLLNRTRGNFVTAEKMYRISLAMNEALDRKVGIANDYVNLGDIYKIRGHVNQAEEMYLKSQSIFAELKSPNEHVVADFIKKLHNGTPEKSQKEIKKKSTKKVEKKVIKEGAVKRKSVKQMAVARYKRK